MNEIETIQQLKQKFPAATEYISLIYLIKRDYGQVNNARLADRLGVSRAAVTQGVARLKKGGYVTHAPYSNIELSESGQKMAESIIRRHYLIEHMLVTYLDYPWDQTDQEAEILQDALSPRLTKHLWEKLNHPTACPHGNPMPGSVDEELRVNAPSMTQIGEKTKFRVLRITEEGEQIEGLLSYCLKNDLKPGAVCTLEQAGPTQLILKKGDTMVKIPHSMAKHIRIDTVV